MANRRKTAAKPKDDRDQQTTGRVLALSGQPRSKRPPKRRAAKNANPGRSVVYHEAMAISLWCASVLTLLSLGSFDAADVSLNASGDPSVRNWVGPAGAYWADLLLQSLGIGAFAFGFGLLLAGWRAFARRRIMPSLREALGGALLILCTGAFAHLLTLDAHPSFPAGGLMGAIAGQLMLENFALIGSLILSGALVLLALAITTDGILSGLGLRSLSIFRELLERTQSWGVMLRERHKRSQELRNQRRQQKLPFSDEDGDTDGDEDGKSSRWTLGHALSGTDRKQRLEKARAKGRAMADADADREVQAGKRRALRDVSEPGISVDKTVDMPAEEAFELGELPAFAPVAHLSAGAPLEQSGEVSDSADVDIPVIAADATPAEPAEALPAPTPEKPVQTAPKRVLKSRKRAAQDGPEIVDVRPDVDVAAIESVAKEQQVAEDPPVGERPFELPQATLLNIEETERAPINPEALRTNADKLIRTLKSYGIDGNIREIRPGPVITMYEYVPAAGVKISKIASLADDIAMSMAAMRVRIVAPIPGKGAVGIEIPNESMETVFLKELVTHKGFRNSPSRLTVGLGKDIEGTPYMADLQRMPHLLVAGATGAGKSVSINSMIMSILFKSAPADVRLLMIDPKMLELSVYDGIPHLLLPVVTDPKKAALALRWAVDEMERRYKRLSAVGVRNITSYNTKIKAALERGERPTVNTVDKLGNTVEEDCEHLPFIVVIVDELADLMMVASREVEASIMRLAQMARAAGIHLILATQRPSVDVITGVIKANFPTRIAFQVASKHDSRTILDGNGAENLLGRGDMLYLAPGVGGLKRVHGAFVSDDEILRTVEFLKQQGEPQYDESILAPREDMASQDSPDEAHDEMYDQAIAIVAETRQASISMIQRRLRIGYNRSARMVETMEMEGIVGPADGSKPREVLVPPPPGA